MIEAEGGKLYDNEIFYAESVVYGRVLKQLLDEGFFVWLCYDAFYSTAKDGWNQERFERHVEELVEEQANRYINELTEFNSNQADLSDPQRKDEDL